MGVAGDIVGIFRTDKARRSPETRRSGPTTCPRRAPTPCSSPWSARGLGVQAGQVFADLDFDGAADDAVEVRTSSTNTIEIVVSYDNGAITIPFNTPIPVGSAPFAGTYFGDFDANGFADIVATIPETLPPRCLCISTAQHRPISSFTSVPAWQASGPYENLTVGRFNNDSIDDVAASKFDGTEDVFLGQAGKGLTTPAHLFPRGFRFFAADDAESYAMAPSFSKKLSFSTPGSIKATPGTIYLMLKDAQGTQYHDAFDLSVDGTAGMPTSEPADAYGSAMAWGNFSKNAQGLADLVTGAPQSSRKRQERGRRAVASLWCDQLRYPGD